MVIRFESTMSSQSLLYYGFLKYYLWLYKKGNLTFFLVSSEVHLRRKVLGKQVASPLPKIPMKTEGIFKFINFSNSIFLFEIITD